jgi:hypothetical protein
MISNIKGKLPSRVVQWEGIKVGMQRLPRLKKELGTTGCEELVQQKAVKGADFLMNEYQ